MVMVSGFDVRCDRVDVDGASATKTISAALGGGGKALVPVASGPAVHQITGVRWLLIMTCREHKPLDKQHE